MLSEHVTQKADGDSGSFALLPQKQTLQNLFQGLTANRPISSAGLPFLALLVLSYIWLPTICLWPKWTKSQLQVGSKRLTWVYWDGFRAQKWGGFLSFFLLFLDFQFVKVLLINQSHNNISCTQYKWWHHWTFVSATEVSLETGISLPSFSHNWHGGVTVPLEVVFGWSWIE